MTTKPDVSANGGEMASRRDSMSNKSDDSQTAADFIREQEVLEADAREALPYSIENCTKILGPLRQNVFACLTCSPSPELAKGSTWTPAGVCYACSVSCHGDHTLVEIFQKRNFTCDCGTTRLPSSSPCNIRTNDETNTRGNVHSEEPSANNKYNQNFRNRFCGCECDYDPHTQKGTMFQCLGLGSEDTGGCGEDWYHPGCLVGKGPTWYEDSTVKQSSKPAGAGLETISEEALETKIESHSVGDANDDDPPMPPGFPEEDAFDGFICYKCIESQPWIKKYAGSAGFLPPVFLEPADEAPAAAGQKRKASPEAGQGESKRAKSEQPADDTPALAEPSKCKLDALPAEPPRRFSLLFHENFREKLCHCSSCYRKLNDYPQLLEEEETYEPPVSDDGESQHGGSTHGSGSLLERGESALRNVDRVRAIEGVMAYNHLKEQLKPFFQQFAASGQAIGAEDIKAYFAKLRGDEEAIKQAGAGAAQGGDKDDDNNGRHEQSGY